ncbi:hypothetical protein C1645_860782, partial [Glomus cerebriforme]
MMSKPVKYPNAFIYYRKDKIDHVNKRQMTVHSKLIAQKWQNESDLCKRKYYQAAAKDYVEKANASGRNGNTVKTFEQFGNIAFINEIPISHDIDQNPDKCLRQSEISKEPVSDFDQQIDKETVTNQVTNDEDLFIEFTVNTDYVQPTYDFNDDLNVNQECSQEKNLESI